jgi:hypothetical protein
MQLCRRIFGANRTPEEVIDLLQAILNRTISDEEWDSFVSVKIADPNLERVRMRIEELWVEDSEYRVPGSINPTDLNPKGVAEILSLIDSIKN